MKFKKIIINDEEINFSNKDNNIMIYSNNNTAGKTTILRSIIFGLGNNTNTITDNISQVDVMIQIDDYKIERSTSKPNNIKLNGKLFDISKEMEYDIFTQEIFNVDSKTFNLLLPTYYIDQEFGWKTINIGKIHPENNLKMNLLNIVANLFNKKEFIIIGEKIKELQKNQKKINNFLEKLPNEKNRKKEILIKKDFSFMNDYILKKRKLEIELKKGQILSKDFDSFIRIIQRFNSIYKALENEKIEEIKQFLELEKKIGEIERQEIKNTIHAYEEKIKILVNLQKYNFFEEKNEEKINKINNAWIIAQTITNLKKEELQDAKENEEQRIKELKSELKELKKFLNEATKQEYYEIFQSVSHKLDSKINFSANDLFSDKTNIKFSSISGVKKGIIILLVRRYIRELAFKKIKFRLPLIVDTINNNDPSEKSIELFLEIISKMIDESGSIFASVKSNFMEKTVDKLKMKAQKMNFKKKKDNQMSISEI